MYQQHRSTAITPPSSNDTVAADENQQILLVKEDKVQNLEQKQTTSHHVLHDNDSVTK